MKIVYLSFLLIISTLHLYSQDINIAEIKNCRTRINTINGNSIYISIEIDFSNNLLNGYTIDEETFNALNQDVKLKLVSNKFPELVNEKIVGTITAPAYQISFKFDQPSDELISLLQDSVADIYVQVDRDISFNVIKGEDENTIKTLKLTKLQIEKHTRNKSVLTDGMANELINAKGGAFFITQNKIDFGLIPSNESSSEKNEFNASFKIRKKYSFLDDLPLYFYTEGLLSTNSSDSLNYLMVYPLNYNFLNKGNELVGQLGVEGDQTFSNYRVTGNFYWNGLIPNVVDLTFGENRLRLKPVMKLGVKFYKEFGNSRVPMYNENEFSNQIFGELFYHIPVMKIYSIILEGKAFYDFSSSINPDRNINYNFSATVGIDIPKTDFKTIFKYTKGNNMVSSQSDDYLMLGLLVDLFKSN